MHRCSIEWADYVWNPLTGCLDDCPYCNARKQAKQMSGDVRLHMASAERWKDTDIFLLREPFPARNGRSLPMPYGFCPTLHLYRMNGLETRKVGAKIIVGSMTDLFADWVPDELIEMVFAECLKHTQHTYFFLTREPERYVSLANKGHLPKQDNMWYGTTVPTEDTRWFYGDGFKTFLNIEPILADFPVRSKENLRGTDWIIVGAEMKVRPEPVAPEKEWILHISEVCKKAGTPVFMRNSLKEIMGEDFYQEYPDILTVPPELTVKQKARLIDWCGLCKTELPKKEMIAILSREKRGVQPVGEGYLCRDCYKKLHYAFQDTSPWKLK